MATQLAPVDAPTLSDVLQLCARYAEDPDGLAAAVRDRYPEYWRQLVRCELVGDPAAQELVHVLVAA